MGISLIIISEILSLMSKNVDNVDKQIIRTWLAGHSSCILVIPKDFAKEYGLDKPSHVIIQGTPQGILIKKLEI
jgi:hypothetical protein